MIVEIALGIVLAIVMIVVGIAALAILIRSLPAILFYVACLGSLLLLTQYLGGWGCAIWFVLLIGFTAYLDRGQLFKPKPHQ